MPQPLPTGDPVPAITEADASGETAAIYADIRAVTGVPVVNLIWRHLATMDGALPWTWGALRQLYADETVARAAAALRSDLDLPPLIPWPASVLESVGLSENDCSAISRILRSYDRSNAMNLVALAALQAHIRGEASRELVPEANPGAGIDGDLPALLTFDRMTAATADLVHRLNAIGDPEHRVIASMYRHLAHWPAFLALSWERLLPLETSGRIDAIIGDNLEKAQATARALAALIPDRAKAEPTAAPPSAETVTHINAALDLFIQYAIGRMVPLGSLLSRSFPHGD